LRRIKKGDINHLDLTTKGYGPTKRVASNDEEENRKQNRRIEIIFDYDKKNS